MNAVTRGGLLLSLVAILVFLAGGCGGGNPPKQAEGDTKDAKGAKDSQAQAGKDKSVATSHGEWWCEEHGVPEDECIMCSAQLKAEAKAKGDWCKHNRARSQCFACDPKLKETFAAKYRAQSPGKEPPPPTEND